MPTVGVLPALISQSKSSSLLWSQEHVSNSKLQRSLKPSGRQIANKESQLGWFILCVSSVGGDSGEQLTADVVVLIRVVPAVVDQVTQVVFGDAVAIRACVLLRCARPARRKRWRAVQEANVVDYQVAHVADPSLGPEHDLREGTISVVSRNTHERPVDNRTSS